MTITQIRGRAHSVAPRKTPRHGADVLHNPSGEGLEALFEWGARIAKEANLTKERRQDLLKEVRREF